MIFAAAHVTGVNWTSVGAIATILGLVQATLLWVFSRQAKQRDARQATRDQERAAEEAELRQEIARSVDHLSEVLLAKLETKETVAAISERLARVEGAAGLQAQKHL